MKLTRHPARFVAAVLLAVGVILAVLAATPVRTWIAAELAEAGYYRPSLSLLHGALRREAVIALGYEVDPDVALLEDERADASIEVLALKRELLNTLGEAVGAATQEAERAYEAGRLEEALEVSLRSESWLAWATTLRRSVGGPDQQAMRAASLRLAAVRVKIHLAREEWEGAVELLAEGSGVPILGLATPEPYVHLGDALMDMGLWERAGELAAEGLRLHGTHARLQYLEMLARVAVSDLDGAGELLAGLLDVQAYRSAGTPSEEGLVNRIVEQYRREIALRSEPFAFELAHEIVTSYAELGLDWDRRRLMSTALGQEPQTVVDSKALGLSLQGFTVRQLVGGNASRYQVQVYWDRPDTAAPDRFEIIERDEEGVWIALGNRMCYEGQLSNRVENGGFDREESAVGLGPGWKSRVFDLTDLRGFVVSPAEGAEGGRGMLTMSNAYDPDTGLRSNAFPVEPGELLIVGVDYRGRGGRAYLAARFLASDPGDDEPEATIENLVQQDYVLAAGRAERWTREEAALVVPLGATWMRLWLFNLGPGTRAWFDNVHVFPVPVPVSAFP